jgi:hypothetical protein
VDIEASLRLPGSSVTDAQGSQCDPQTPTFAVAKGPSGQRIRVGADDRLMGLARWNPRRAHRTTAAARRRCYVAESGCRGRGFALLDPPASVPPPPVAGLEAVGRHQDR